MIDFTSAFFKLRSYFRDVAKKMRSKDHLYRSDAGQKFVKKQNKQTNQYISTKSFKENGDNINTNNSGCWNIKFGIGVTMSDILKHLKDYLRTRPNKNQKPKPVKKKDNNKKGNK